MVAREAVLARARADGLGPLSRRPGASLNAAAGLAIAALCLSGCAGTATRATLDVPAPRWSLPTTDGDTLHSDRLKGRVTVLVWIDPTCAEVQTAADGGALRIAERRWMEDSRVEILYIASMAGGGGDWLAPADWKPWLKDMKLRAPVVVDSAQTLAKAWKVRRIPSAGIVDTAGRVLWSGPVDAMDSTGEPVVSGAIAQVLEGRHAWVPEQDPQGGCPLHYLH